MMLLRASEEGVLKPEVRFGELFEWGSSKSARCFRKTSAERTTSYWAAGLDEPRIWTQRRDTYNQLVNCPGTGEEVLVATQCKVKQ